MTLLLLEVHPRHFRVKWPIPGTPYGLKPRNHSPPSCHGLPAYTPPQINGSILFQTSYSVISCHFPHHIHDYSWIFMIIHGSPPFNHQHPTTQASENGDARGTDFPTTLPGAPPWRSTSAGASGWAAEHLWDPWRDLKGKSVENLSFMETKRQFEPSRLGI